MAMAADVLINSLPCEVLEQILENKNLRISDVTNFAMSCKQLYWTVTTMNKLWKTKFFQRWPVMLDAFETQAGSEIIKNVDWREEVNERITCRKLLLEKLSQMSAKHYQKEELSAVDLKEYDPLFLPEYGVSPMRYHYLTDELINIIEEPILTCNLTHKHYAYKVIRYLRQTHLAKEWETFLALPTEKQTTERGAILVAQWSQPEKRVSARKVSDMLDDIAQQTREYIAEKYPHILIKNVPPAKLLRWKNENLYDNEWSNEDSRTIVSSLCEIMFNTLGFHGNSEMYYSSENSFIDQVLIHRRGIPITLAIVFGSVARRLGIHCETVSFPAHFLLRWKERYLPRTKEDKDVESYYIDVFNGGKFLTRNNCSGIAGGARCPIEKNNFYQATSAVKVVRRMANNLEVAGRQRTHLNGRAARLRSALELLHMVKPRDTNTILHLARFYILHQMDVTDLIKTLDDMLAKGYEKEESRGQAKHIMQLLEDYEKRIEVKSPTPKKRTTALKYAVGMILADRDANLCVVAGWDIKCERLCATEYQRELDHSLFNDRIGQPHYDILMHDGSCRYASQETLTISRTPRWINHYEIGRFFSKFTGTYYQPNEEKAKEYPEDELFVQLMAL